MTPGWPAVSYDRWGPTCDTLHAHTQVLGKLAVELAPPEAELQHAALGEYILDWDDVGAAPDPRGAALDFAHSAFRHACLVGGWDPALPASADGSPPPIR